MVKVATSFLLLVNHFLWFSQLLVSSDIFNLLQYLNLARLFMKNLATYLSTPFLLLIINFCFHLLEEDYY